MYGRYSRQLGEFARQQGLIAAEKKRIKQDKKRAKELRGYRGKIHRSCAYLWKHTFARLGEDWVFLALLGALMALISFLIDRGVQACTMARLWLYKDLSDHPAAQYFAWISLPICLILFTAGFVFIVAPQSIGSGIPEMKTILRGVALNEYLSFRTLVAKVIGLMATLGSGLPLGKEGPLVHIASIIATLLSKLVTSFQGIYENESRNTEMLGAACAVGVATCFAAPVGGVLFSIEVTTVYFAVRSYWRGFFAAVWGAIMYRLFSAWFEKTPTVMPLFRTNFAVKDVAFDPQELIVFALIGVVSGFLGALYVWMHRRYVLFMRSSKKLNKFLQRNRLLYPGLVVLVVMSITFPDGLGQFMAGDVPSGPQVVQLFSNFTWSSGNLTVEQAAIVNKWVNPYAGIFVNLASFAAFQFIFSIISTTCPLPAGAFVPVLKVGAAIGRMVGEGMHLWFPGGISYAGVNHNIIPGGYATVGASAFTGAVTHTISVSVIVFELTGQLTHLLPILIATLIANAIAGLLGPSCYDSVIIIKKLPYLPDFLPVSSGMYFIYVEDFMVRDVKYIYHGITYEQLKELLRENRNLQSFPLVDTPENMILLGSVQRLELIKLIEQQIGRERRLQVATQWYREALEEEQRRMEDRQRRPSRFQVIPAPDSLRGRQMSENQLDRDREQRQPTLLPVFSVQPKKSILKKTNSFTLRGFTPVIPASSPGSTPYTTVTGAESRIRLAFEAIFKKSSQLQDVDPTATPDSPTSPGVSKKVQLPCERVCDMSPEDQKLWEQEEMARPVDFCKCHVDPAPFQLVERTSLLKVHSLFSMIGVNHAYVTATGKLVGVVGLKDLRKAIEDANSGKLPAHELPTLIVTNQNGEKPENKEKEPMSDSDNEGSKSLVSSKVWSVSSIRVPYLK